jgi:hypothetical protein
MLIRFYAAILDERTFEEPTFNAQVVVESTVGILSMYCVVRIYSE